MKLKIIGYSGHANSVLSTIKSLGYEITGYYENVENKNNPYNIPFLGNDQEINENHKIDDKYFVCIGDNFIRSKLSRNLYSKKYDLINIIDLSASVSGNISLGYGNFIGSNSSINSGAILKNNIIVNTSAVIEHDSLIMDGVHIAPNATILGNVYVGENTFIGANSVIKQGVKIGENVTIGAGSVVLKDIPDCQVWAGNPAKKIK